MIEVMIDGVPEVVDILSATADSLDHLDQADRQAGSVVLVAARGKAPRRSGRLAASGLADKGQVAFTVPYAAPIHWGWPSRNIRAQPFLVEALADQETAVVKAYEDNVQRQIDRAG